MPTPCIFLLSLAWVYKLTFLFSCHVIIFVSRVNLTWASEFSHLLFRWRQQNENISVSTLPYPDTRQNSAHKLQAVWGSPWECHRALVSTKRRGSSETNPLWFNQELQARHTQSPLGGRHKREGSFYLIIDKVIKSDEGTYYCACWDLTMSQRHKGPVRKPSLLPTLHSCHRGRTTNGSSMFLIISS